MHWGGYSKQSYQTQISQPFNPVNFDADAIANAAQAAGMKYIVITAKHHEGFAMWPRTAATSFKDYTGTTIYSLPAYTTAHFSRDILMELKNACDARGIKFCLYYSILDWNHSSQTKRDQGPALTTMASMTARSAYIADMKADLQELITRYDPALLWFDGDWFAEPSSPTLDDWWLSSDGQDLYNFVKSKKNTIIVNERVKRDFGLGDYAVAEFGTPSVPMSRQWERCDTMNGAWGYDSAYENPNSYRSAKDLVQEMVTIASREGNLLLNIGPDATGTMSTYAADRLNSIGAWTGIWGSSIYGTTRSPLAADPTWGTCTKKSGFLYCHVFNYPTGGKTKKITLTAITNTISGVYVLNNPGTALSYSISGGNMTITLPSSNPDSTGIDAVIVIACSGIPGVATTTAPPLADGIYKIVNLTTGKPIRAMGTSAGSLVQQYRYNRKSDMQWQVTNLSNNIYKIVCVQSGLALSSQGEGSADGVNAVVDTPNNHAAQQWALLPVGTSFKLVQQGSSQCIGPAGGSSGDGVQIILWHDDGTTNERWTFSSP